MDTMMTDEQRRQYHIEDVAHMAKHAERQKHAIHVHEVGLKHGLFIQQVSEELMSKQEDNEIERIMAQTAREQRKARALIQQQMDLAKEYWTTQGLWQFYRDTLREWIDADREND